MLIHSIPGLVQVPISEFPGSSVVLDEMSINSNDIRTHGNDV